MYQNRSGNAWSDKLFGSISSNELKIDKIMTFVKNMHISRKNQIDILGALQKEKKIDVELDDMLEIATYIDNITKKYNINVRR